MTDVQWATLRPILQDLTDRIARIEQFLAASGLQASAPQPGEFSDAVPTSFGTPPGQSIGQAAAAAHGIDLGGDPGSQPPGIPDYILVMAKTGQQIRAIQELRSVTGLSLKEAKATIDQIARGY